MAKKQKTIDVCDVCGGEVDMGWWECITRCGEVVEENYAPVDLCDDCCTYFSEIADKWKQERYGRVPLDEEQKAVCIKEIIEVKEDYIC